MSDNQPTGYSSDPSPLGDSHITPKKDPSVFLQPQMSPQLVTPTLSQSTRQRRDSKGRFVCTQFKSFKIQKDKAIFKIHKIQRHCLGNVIRTNVNVFNTFSEAQSKKLFKITKVTRKQEPNGADRFKNNSIHGKYPKKSCKSFKDLFYDKPKYRNQQQQSIQFQLEHIKGPEESQQQINYQMIHPKDDNQKTHTLPPEGEPGNSGEARGQDELNLDDDQASNINESPSLNDENIDIQPDQKIYNIQVDQGIPTAKDQMKISADQEPDSSVKAEQALEGQSQPHLQEKVAFSQPQIASKNGAAGYDQDHFTLCDNATQNGQLLGNSQNQNIETLYDKNSVTNIEAAIDHQHNIEGDTQGPQLEPIDSQNIPAQSVKSGQEHQDVLQVASPLKSDSSKPTQRSNMRTRFNGTKVPNQVSKDENSGLLVRGSRRIQIKDQEAQNTNQSVQPDQNNQNESINQLNSSRNPPGQPESPLVGNATPKEQKPAKNQQALAKLDSQQKLKKSSENVFQEYLKSYQNMFQFDWDLKDFVSSRHSPKDELTPGAFWFYINTTFFPYDLQFKLIDQTFEEWVAPIISQINTFSIDNFQQQSGTDNNNHIIKGDQNRNQIKSNYKIHYANAFNNQDQPLIIYDENQQQIEDVDHMLNEDEIPLKHVAKLIGKRKKFNRYKHHFKHLQDRAQKHVFQDDEMKMITESAQKIPRKSILEVDQVSCIQNQEIEETGEKDVKIEEEIAEIKHSIDLQNFQKMITLAEKDLEQIQNQNYQSLKGLFGEVQNKFKDALEVPKDSEKYRDKTLYRPEDIWKYDQSFLAYVDPAFTQDMINNFEWYRQNQSMFLLNINYPCKLQTDFLQELELSQQRRNQMRYRKIMDQMDKMDQALAEGQKIDEAKRLELENDIKNISQLQRAQIAQDDACCAICGSGDYEDHDQIVFCVHCSMPVHQSCFGIEKLTEYDWMCYNCLTFGFKKGQMVKCFICPKKGGAMKPTNIFCSYQKFFEHKILGQQKKSGKSQMEKIQEMAIKNKQLQEEELEKLRQTENGSQVQDNNCIQTFKQSVLARLENNTSLNELVQREENYKNKIYDVYYKEYEKWEKLQKEQGPDVKPDFNPISQKLKEQDEFDFVFNKHEKQNHCIPEDYSRFLQRNQEKLESKETPQTETLYHWVHHSCSMWMPGPQVTPRTPVKMNKLDFSKFNIGCVICCKKGPQAGAVIKCTKQDCQIYFHVECAKRANYCMEIEKKAGINNNREKIFKIFCESHRPFKIIAEINEQNAQEVDDIQKFTKTIDKCMEIYLKHLQKPKKLITKTERNKLLRQSLQNKKQEIMQLRRESKLLMKPKKEKKEQLKAKTKKWKEKDKKMLLDRVKDKYLTIKKMRMNLVKIDPMIAENKRYEKQVKRYQKQQAKKLKNDIQKSKQQFLNQLLQERDNKTQERGLRRRNNSNNDMVISNNDNQSNADKQIENIMDTNLGNEILLNGDNQAEFRPKPDIPFEQMGAVQEDDPMIGLNIDEVYPKTQAQVQIQTETADEKMDDFNKITLDVQLEADELLNAVAPSVLEDDCEESMMPENLPELKEIPHYYKFSNPLNVYELEWKVTLSRYDFPWREISFGQFSAKECYKMYTSIVTDIESFLKRVLGQKPKYQKMIQNQLKGLPTIDYINNMQNPRISLIPDKTKKESLQPIHQMFSISHEPHQNPNGPLQNPLSTLNPSQSFNQPIVTLQNGALLNVSLYCKCKGYIQSDFMVACETGEDDCTNGGWVHPQCTNDLCYYSREEIDKIEIWYCEDCRAKDDEPSGNMDGEMNEEKMDGQDQHEIEMSDMQRAIQEKRERDIQRMGILNMNMVGQLQGTPTKLKRTQDQVNASKGNTIISKGEDSTKKESLIVSIDQTMGKNAVKAVKTQKELEIEKLSVVANIISQEQERQKSLQNSARQAEEESLQEQAKKAELAEQQAMENNIQQQIQMILQQQEQQPHNQERKPQGQQESSAAMAQSQMDNINSNQNFLELLSSILTQQQEPPKEQFQAPAPQPKKPQVVKSQQQPMMQMSSQSVRQPQAVESQMNQQIKQEQNDQIVQQLQQKCEQEAASALQNVLLQLASQHNFEQTQQQVHHPQSDSNHQMARPQQATKETMSNSNQNDFITQLQNLMSNDASQNVQDSHQMMNQFQQHQQQHQHQQQDLSKQNQAHNQFVQQQLMNLQNVEQRQDNQPKAFGQQQQQTIAPKVEHENISMDQQQYQNNQTEMILLNLLNAAQQNEQMQQMAPPSQRQQQQVQVPVPQQRVPTLGQGQLNQEQSAQQGGQQGGQTTLNEELENMQLDLTDEQLQMILSQLTQNN